MKYIQRVRENSSHVPDKLLTHPKPVVTLDANDTLQNVVCTLNEFKIHRVFVTDDQHKPIGVISLFDVIQILFS